MTRIRNVRIATKFKRSIKAISPVIATLLMIAIAVVASLVAYAWVMGYMGGATDKAGKAIQIQSWYRNQTTGLLTVYVQNVGQGTVEFKAGQSIYVNGDLIGITSAIQPLAEGQTAELVTDRVIPANEKVEIKVTTTDGTFTIQTGTGTNGQGEPTVTPVPTTPPGNQFLLTVQAVPNSLSPAPSGGGLKDASTSVQLTAPLYTGYTFSYWALDNVPQGSTNPITVVMNAAHIASAHYSQNGRTATHIGWDGAFTDYVYLGDQVTVYGQLQDSSHNEVTSKIIHITLVGPDGTIVTLPDATTSGHPVHGFTSTYTPLIAGTWTAYAYFDGDSTYSASQNSHQFTVAEKKMHLSLITIVVDNDFNERYADAKVTVFDSNGEAVEGVTVTGTWSGDHPPTTPQQSDATNHNGIADFLNPASGTHHDHYTSTWTFTVNSIVLTGWTYDSAANTHPLFESVTG